uniref:RNA-directed DNA polymerase n=1 Tax=Haemonchus contortus TaxID=6289 RepID=W6NQT5_HAECO
MSTPAVTQQESQFDRMARRIDKFSYDPDQDDCFNLRYNRHKDIFDIDCEGMEEKTKTRLLVSALDAAPELADYQVRFLRRLDENEKITIDDLAKEYHAWKSVKDGSKIVEVFNAPELDTGAEVTIISRPTWMQMGGPQLQKTSDTLRGANGLPLRIYGKFDAAFVAVDNRGKAHSGQGVCYVSDDNDLLGITWIEQIPDFNLVLKRFNVRKRWRLTLLAYNFDIEYRNTNNFEQADAFSCLIATQSPPEEEDIIAKIARDINAIFHENVNRLPVTAKDVARATAEDDTLRQVLEHIAHNNWPKKPSSAIASYAHLRNDPSTQQGCLLFESRIIIPRSPQPQTLKMLHEGHPRINRMKSLARRYVFWTRINEDLEKLVRTCTDCQEAAKSPVKNTLCSWPHPDSPWTWIHIDFAGPHEGISYLVIVDAFSKWHEVIPMTSTTTTATLKELNRLFTQFAFPHVIVSDNGTQFTSAEFQKFCRHRVIEHVRSPPFHPQSNGQNERFVDTFKRSLLKMKNHGPTLDALLIC